MKIHRWIISLVFCCCVTFLSAQIRGTEITVVVSPDHTDWKYQLKEECSFTIQVYKAQNLLPGVVSGGKEERGFIERRKDKCNGVYVCSRFFTL